MIHPGLFKLRAFSTANVASLLFGSAFFVALPANVLFLTGVWHYSILKAGFAITPGPLCSVLIAGPAGKLAGRYGYRTVLVPGTLIFVAAMAYLPAPRPRAWRSGCPPTSPSALAPA